MRVERIITRMLDRECKKARRPEIYRKNRFEFLWELYKEEGYEAILNRYYRIGQGEV